jgi:hypothetical protein
MVVVGEKPCGKFRYERIWVVHRAANNRHSEAIRGAT